MHHATILGSCPTWRTNSFQYIYLFIVPYCPAVYLNGKIIPQETTVQYLGMHLDRRLTWKPHIHNKRKQLGLMLHRMYWIIGRKSKLSLTNKLLIYKIILKPIWTYGIPLWGTAFQSNIEILQRLQKKPSEWWPTHHGSYPTMCYTLTFKCQP